MIDNKLSWQHHIKELRNKLASNNSALYKLRGLVDRSTLKMVYYSLIYSHLQYCISVWGTAAGVHQDQLEPGKNWKQLETQQKRAIRNICSLPPREHTAEHFKSLELLKIKDIYKMQLGKLIYKFSSNQLVNDNN